MGIMDRGGGDACSEHVEPDGSSGWQTALAGLDIEVLEETPDGKKVDDRPMTGMPGNTTFTRGMTPDAQRDVDNVLLQVRELVSKSSQTLLRELSRISSKDLRMCNGNGKSVPLAMSRVPTSAMGATVSRANRFRPSLPFTIAAEADGLPATISAKAEAAAARVAPDTKPAAPVNSDKSEETGSTSLSGRGSLMSAGNGRPDVDCCCRG
eukprot:TRINITY_DN21157_c0_g2_i4.p2 TRINITY_DN21157_c0_g2~~TRINITY_DN21157_c0_g2_i4.p2  ORF type:complete len:209 (+),score=39.68 TRINITY_DN21157_c0_g2_i4:86-712(+)